MDNPDTTTPAAESADNTAPDYIGTATYSPEDNKIRISAFSRLPRPLYDRIRAAGFIWAPRQEIFVAPMWTVDREDLAIELCGELGDEDKSLVDRAEERAERFDEYSEKRAADADRAHAGVAAIADGIPLGQPILVGHHSERRARKDAERIENGMRKAVKMWETSQYWISRAKGALRHAKYKELPGVRARRIKGLEADKRKRERQLGDATEAHTFWLRSDLTIEQAREFAGRGSGDGFTMPRKEGDRPDFAQRCSAWDALSGSWPNLYAPRTLQEVIDRALAVYPGRVEYLTRWILHYENRIAYEKAMLDEQGASHLIAPRPRPTQLPLLNYRKASIVAPRWGRALQTFPQVEMTSEDYKRIYSEQRGTLTVDGSHRVRFAFVELRDGKPARFADHSKGKWSAVFLTDSKAHAEPKKDAPPAQEPVQTEAEQSAKETRILAFADRCVEADKLRAAAGASSINVDTHEMKFDRASEAADEAHPRSDPVQNITQGRTIWNSDGTEGPALICAPTPEPKPEPVKDNGAKFAALKQTLKAGIKVVAAPQLFPTPHDLAQRMADLADIRPDHRVLEPSAGTGALLNGITQSPREIVAVEINVSLADRLRQTQGSNCRVVNADFLQCNGDLGTFDRIVMNPPFQNGADVLHVRHALNKLNAGGKLVAIVAGGPRQKAALEPFADYWEELPDGTFAEQGTNVRTVLLVIEKRG